MVRSPANRPFHNLATIRELAEEGKIKFGNHSASRDAKTLDLDKVAVRKFILCLRSDHFFKRYPTQKCFDGREQLDCDAYKMSFDSKLLCENSTTGDLIFAKLGIHQQRDGKNIAIVSFHLDR